MSRARPCPAKCGHRALRKPHAPEWSRGRGLRWDQPLQAWYGASADSASADGAPLQFDGDEVTEIREGSASDFEAVLANADGVGYGLFRLDDGSRSWLLDNLPDVGRAVSRAVAWLTLWDALLERSVTPERWLSAAVAAIEVEPEELLLTRMLADLRTAYWRFFTLEESAAVSEQLEALLWTRLEAVDGASLKASFFATYRSIAPCGFAWTCATGTVPWRG